MIPSLKVQRRINRRIGDKTYEKFYIGLPSQLVKESGWNNHMDLDYVIKKNKVILKPRKNQ